MARVRGWRWVFALFVFCAVTAISNAQVTFTALANFDGANGAFPQSMNLIQGSDGNFYGTTEYGGANDKGTVFKMSPGGSLTTLHSFCAQGRCGDGEYPQASLIQATSGKFYGTTYNVHNNINACGTVFEITAVGVLTVLHTFEGYDGCGPLGGLIQAANGDLYGTTHGGGASLYGAIFKITLDGALTTLYSFCSRSKCADGALPDAPLVQGSSGSFYGTTASGGANHNDKFCSSTGCGTVFELTTAGKLIRLYSSCSLANCADGTAPTGGLVQATNGNLYGVAQRGGAYGSGTVFEIDATGKLTTLYNFCAQPQCSDGGAPQGSLVQATDGNFYGTTSAGGEGRYGTIFELTPGGTLTTLYNFCDQCQIEGASPKAGLLQATNGGFYGTTSFEGSAGYGTVFRLNTGLGPFVSFIRNPAKVGQQFGILGYGLTGASNVSFNGITAKFKAQSDTLLVATVPSGASTGYVTVTTPSGTLTSNVPFHVIP
jgi:uncharacterized repeat protein (TIGR03803 family)